MLTKLELRRADDAMRDPVAWFLPGGDSAEWLAEVATWAVPLEEVRFYLVARGSEREPWAPLGALAVPAQPLSSPPTGCRAQPYGRVGRGKLYLPVDARLWPPVDDAEIASAARHAVLIFHPAAGLAGFEDDEARCGWEFVSPPPSVAEDWDVAVGPLPLNERLRSVRLAEPLLPEDLYGEESKDIGRDAADILPPEPNEPRSPFIRKILLGAGAAAAAALLMATRLAPRTASAPTWLNALEGWVTQRMAGARGELDRLRHKELNRLLEGLRTNPEDGLRHALPLTAFAHRGRTATNSTQLGQRNLDFSFARLGGGQAADFWNVPADMQRELANRYREAAHRELKLGRHRRAACIFAELLGDLTSAADALKQGKYFREAAMLYEQKLNQPLAAAACFAEGGLLVEAIALYEKHQRWLDVAALYERLGAHDEARTALRREVEVKRAAGDILTAAKLLETRLSEPDVALELLASTWSSGQQTLACLHERFALLDRLHRGPEMQALLRALARETAPRVSVAELVGVMTRVAETAVAAPVRAVAADVVRVKASGALASRELSDEDERAVLKALMRLAPHDRLLARDTTRYSEQRPALARRRPVAAGGSGGRITLEAGRPLSLPKIGRWCKVIGDQHAAYAMATTPQNRIFFSRMSWQGAVQSADWPDPAPQTGKAFALTQAEQTIILARFFAAGLPIAQLPSMEVFGGRGCVVGTPPWFPPDTVQAVGTRHGVLVLRIDQGCPILATYTNGQLAWSYDITDKVRAAGAAGEGASMVIEMCKISGVVALAYGKFLFTIEDGKVSVVDVGNRVVRLLPASEVIGGWVLLFDRGAAYVHWRERAAMWLNTTLEFPSGAFLQGGRLVLIDEKEGYAWNTAADGFTLIGTFAAPSTSFDTITPTNKENEFALWDHKGSATRWEIT